MAVQLILKNSAVQDKHPNAAQLAKGEIALNFHESGPYLTCEDSSGEVKRIAGVTQSSSTPGSPLEGTFWWNTNSNKLLLYAGGEWNTIASSGSGGGGGGAVESIIGGDGIAISPSSGTGTVTTAVDLAGGDDGLEFSGGKLRASVASNSVLGSVKVDGTSITATNGVISAASQAGDTDLGLANRGTETLDITSSTGDDVTVPAATTSQAGLMTAAQASKLDGIEAGAEVNVDPTQSYTAAATDGKLTLSPGGDETVIPAATTTEAGLMTAADKAKVDAGYVLPIASDSVLGGIKVGARLTITADGVLNADNQGGGGTVGTLQEVTDEGNTTTNDISTDGKLTANTANIGRLLLSNQVISTDSTALILQPADTKEIQFKTKNTNSIYKFFNADETYRGDLRFNQLTANQTFNLPDKSGMFALLDDIPATPDLQAVTDEGSTTSNPATFASLTTTSGNYLSDVGVNLKCGGTGIMTFRTKNSNSDYRFFKEDESNYGNLRFDELTGNYSFTFPNKAGIIALLDDIPAAPTVGDGALTIKTSGEGAPATGTFTANQSAASELVLPQIRYQDLSGKPTIPSEYVLPTASDSVLGGIKVGARLTIDANGVLSADNQGGGGTVGTLQEVTDAGNTTTNEVVCGGLSSSGTADATSGSIAPSLFDQNFVSGTAMLSIGQCDSLPCIQGQGSGTAFHLHLNPRDGDVYMGPSKVIQLKENGSVIAASGKFGNITTSSNAITGSASVTIESGGTSGLQFKTKNANSDYIYYTSDGSYTGKLRFSNLTSNRNYSLPDLGGTIALTSDIPAAQDLQAVTDVGNTTTNGATFGGDVGIGTDSPAAKLHTVGSDNEILKLENSGNTFQGIGFYGTGDALKGRIKTSTVNSNVYIEADPSDLSVTSSINFSVDGTERAQITSDGSLGIGGTLPGSPNITLNATGLGTFNGGVRVNGGSLANTVNGMYGSSDLRLVTDSSIALYMNGARAAFYGTSTTPGFANSSLLINSPISGSSNSYGTRSQGLAQPDVTGTASVFFSRGGTDTGTAVTNLYQYTASGGTMNGTAVNTAGFNVSNSIAVGTAKNYGFLSQIDADDEKNYNFYASGSAPNFLQGSTYISGSTTRNTLELWKSLLTEEQKDELNAGTLVAPANVSNPGDGEFFRQWWYDQQSAEDQALIDSGELEYPEKLQPANFTDSFALGDNTTINLNTSGLGEFKGGVKVSGGTSNGTDTGMYSQGGSGLYLAQNKVTFLQKADNEGTRIRSNGSGAFAQNSGFILSVGGTFDHMVEASTDSNRNCALRVSPNPSNADISFPTFGFSCVHSSLNANSTNASNFARIAGFTAAARIGEFGSENINYGFEGLLNVAAGKDNYNFYAGGSAPNYFAGLTEVGGTPGTGNIQLNADGSASFNKAVKGGTVGSIANSTSFSLLDSNFWVTAADASTIANPTNIQTAMSGVIYCTAAVTAWGDKWKWPGGAAPDVPANSVVPYYVKLDGEIITGLPTKEYA